MSNFIRKSSDWIFHKPTEFTSLGLCCHGNDWNLTFNLINKMSLFYCLCQVWAWYHPRGPRGSQSVREKRQDESFQVRAKEPLGTDFHLTISKNSSRCQLLIGHKKCFVLLCPIGEQFLLSSFRELVHDGYCLDHGLSGSCSKEMHANRKLSVGHIKIPIWFQNTVCPRTKDAFPKIQPWAYNRYSRLNWSRLL